MILRRLVWRSGSLVVVVVLSRLGLWVLCSEAADGGISLRKCDVLEDIAVDNPPGTCICRIDVSDSRVGFYFTYMGCEALSVFYLDVVFGFHKEIVVWVMFVVEWVGDVVSDRVDAKGAICEDAELGEVLVEF